jgi:hypothetical protein
LCSQEHFRAAYQALRDGGLYCQWLPMHQLTAEQYDVIARTFQTVFSEVYLFRNHFKTKGIPLALIGFKNARLDWAIPARRCSIERSTGRITDPICRHPEGLAMLYLGQYSAKTPNMLPINTQDNLWIELDSGLRWITGRNLDYYNGAGDAWLSLLRNQVNLLAME